MGDSKTVERRSADEMRRMFPYLYDKFSREEWAKLRANMPLEISDEDLDALRGLNDPVSLEEVEAIYLPLGRLLNIHIAMAHGLGRVKDSFGTSECTSDLHYCGDRQRGRGQEHVFARAGRGTFAGVRSSVGGTGDDGRVSASQRGAGRAGADGAEGLPGELRPSQDAGVYDRAAAGRDDAEGSGVFP